jgi:ankyrin repeat protein
VSTAKKWVNCSHESCTTDDRDRYTPLIHAAANGHVEVVRVLLEGGANVQRANFNQRTALHLAAWYGHLAVCRLLLDRGAKVDAVDKWKDTPLHDAARLGQLSVVKLLVERGADVRLKNSKVQTARDMAWINGKVAVKNWLDSVSRG